MDFHSLDATDLGAIVFIVAIIVAVSGLYTVTNKFFGKEKGEKAGDRVFVFVALILFLGMMYGIFK